VVIKARINVQYLENVEVLPLWAVLRSEPAAVVFAPRAFVGASDPEIATPQWRDWNLVLSEAGAAAMHAASRLANGSAPLYNASYRCYGYCVEEQLRLQLEARGFSYRELPWRLTQHRIYHHAAPNETAAARAVRLESAKPTGAEGGAWRAAHGLAAKHSDQCSVSGSAAESPIGSKVAEVVR